MPSSDLTSSPGRIGWPLVIGLAGLAGGTVDFVMDRSWS